jgi:hypothetical protein
MTLSEPFLIFSLQVLSMCYLLPYALQVLSQMEAQLPALKCEALM